jgi:hypothetical protein
MRTGRCALIGILSALVLPAAAMAMPGDPPVVPLTPADGATLPVDPNGIPVSYTCPVYRIADPGFPLFGGPKDYGITLSDSPALGSDGRLASGTLNTGTADPVVPNQCSSRLGAGGPPPRVQETPGTYYWQAWRLCTGCVGSYETGPVRRLVLQSEVDPTLRAPRRAYAGYPFMVSLALEGTPDGTAAVVQRRAGSRWRRAGTATALGGQGEAVVVLPRGAHRLRPAVTIGAQRITGPARRVSVARAARWSTGPAADGRYKGRVGSRSVRFTVTRAGRELRNFRAFVPMLCPGTTPGQFTTQIGTAALNRVRIAPDGRFVAALKPERSTAILLTGRLRGRKVSGRVRLSVGPCSGNSGYRAGRTSG